MLNGTRFLASARSTSVPSSWMPPTWVMPLVPLIMMPTPFVKYIFLMRFSSVSDSSLLMATTSPCAFPSPRTLVSTESVLVSLPWYVVERSPSSQLGLPGYQAEGSLLGPVEVHRPFSLVLLSSLRRPCGRRSPQGSQIVPRLV